MQTAEQQLKTSRGIPVPRTVEGDEEVGICEVKFVVDGSGVCHEAMNVKAGVVVKVLQLSSLKVELGETTKCSPT